jgi:hypothetical protein
MVSYSTLSQEESSSWKISCQSRNSKVGLDPRWTLSQGDKIKSIAIMREQLEILFSCMRILASSSRKKRVFYKSTLRCIFKMIISQLTLKQLRIKPKLSSIKRGILFSRQLGALSMMLLRCLLISLLSIKGLLILLQWAHPMTIEVT